MLFNSIEFGVFLITVFILYWYVFQNSLRWQNLFIVVVSYFFYGWWDWRFLSLILFSTVVDYFIGLAMDSAGGTPKRKRLLYISLATNLGFLGFFKYYNFFVESFVSAFNEIGIELHPATLKIILPVGISFYTFQSLSYTIDVYRKHLKPTKSLIDFAAFVSFFPQLVAGPIERATQLLPQFYQARKFNSDLAKDGLRQMLWGFFKKIVIADNCAIWVNEIFDNYDTMPASSLVLGSIFFAFQIYGDFSGYSDIAIGTARMFGFKIMRNFAFPYFSRDMAEFWRRWHISLSTFFRDYLYYPLGGSRGSRWQKVRNTAVVFLVSGFWHGANWTFITWGAINAVYFLPLLLLNKNRQHTGPIAEGRWLPNLKEVSMMTLTFGLTCFAWIFFRSSTMAEAMGYVAGLFDISILKPSKYLGYLPLLGLVIIPEWLMRRHQHALEVAHFPLWSRWTIYYIVLGLIIILGQFNYAAFIYFQF